MVDDKTLRALATALPDVVTSTATTGQVAYEVAGKGLAWSYLARPAPKAKRVLVPGVIAVRCLIETKQMLIEAAPERFFDDAHYRGYPAVLVRLAVIEADELAGLLRTAWTIVAPKSLVKSLGGAGGRTPGLKLDRDARLLRYPLMSAFPVKTALAALLILAAPADAAPSPEVPWGEACPQKPAEAWSRAERETAWATRQGAEPLCLFMASAAWASHDPDKAALLYRLAATRREYDRRRCVEPPRGQMSSAMMAIRMQAGAALQAAGAKADPAQVATIGRDPETYRYRSDHLETMCDGPVRPERDWDRLRDEMRREIDEPSPQD
ncbi:MmcQ/YjbR family DNA-binding protein [Caulobacter endophyticus]|uniref:MmcQ/YjbR family DNA-binding protein n=1 Tax=Caulobacter endophyticus TaxID=2172652 RepID=UPI00240ED9BD|nr:hypothetical protein [Caulobacter endophyticus]MDG2531948.1 hypothetical protein [Caulobacter endophyticus]